jgi:hypothetical protein
MRQWGGMGMGRPVWHREGRMPWGMMIPGRCRRWCCGDGRPLPPSLTAIDFIP